MRKKLRGSLYRMMTVMTIIPLTIFGIVVSVYCSHQFAATMETEVAEGLKNMTVMMLNTYDILYPGDYELLIGEGQSSLWKGGVNISGTGDLMDHMKEQTGTDLTIFFYDTRMITTICNNAGEHIVGSGSSPVVFRDVFEGKEAHFYERALVNGVEYFAYYMPLYNRDGTCIGMAFAGKPTEKVQMRIRSAVLPIILCVLCAVILTGWFAVRYTTKMVESVKRMEKFLTGVSSGILSDTLDEDILKREDELGRMGRAAVKMQRSLRELIDQDALTGLYNRRYGNLRLTKVKERAEYTGAEYTIVIGDIDFFKKVNDTYGHECGDVVLKNVATLLKESMLGRGTAIRWGGEEFLLIFEGIALEDANKVMEGILDKIRAYVTEYGDSRVKVTMTFGMAEGTPEEASDETLRKADDKLYFGKTNGRNQIVV